MFKELKFFPSKLSCTAKPRDITLVTFPHHLPSIKEFRKGIRQKRKCFTPEQQTTLSLHSHFHFFLLKSNLLKKSSHTEVGELFSHSLTLYCRDSYSASPQLIMLLSITPTASTTKVIPGQQVQKRHQVGYKVQGRPSSLNIHFGKTLLKLQVKIISSKAIGRLMILCFYHLCYLNYKSHNQNLSSSGHIVHRHLHTCIHLNYSNNTT